MRISVTDLDGFLYWKSTDDDLEVLLRRLRRQEEPTQQMLAGRAFHKVLEEMTLGDLHRAEKDGFTFVFSLESALYLPEIRELKGEVNIATDYGPVTLVGVVDGLTGKTANDYKLSERFDAEKYVDSYQWRSYLMMFNANKFVYDVFVYRVDPISGEYNIYDYSTMPFYRYEGMEKDVRSVVNELAQIIKRYMPEAA